MVRLFASLQKTLTISYVKGSDMTKTHFKMASRTAALIGRENVSSADGALIELVKNTYDADASLCFLWIDPEEDAIYVYDNGEGMDERVIEDSWMTIGTNDKQVNYMTKKGRTKSGEKGIGRFALDRLGRSCVMFTQKKGDDEVLRWTIIWDDFDVEGMLLEDIEADLSRCDSTLKAQIPNALRGNIEHRARVQGISQEELWGSGTLLKIEHLRDAWQLNEREKFLDALEILIPPQEQTDFSVNYVYEVGSAYETIGSNASIDFDYHLECAFDGHEFDITLYRDEFIVDRMPANLFSRKEFSAFPYRKTDFESRELFFRKSIEEVMGTSDLDVIKNVSAIGPFSFAFSFARLASTRESNRIQFVKPIGKSRSQWFSLYGGVKIYRDNFWVRPYGEKGSAQFDWLGLDSRHANNPQGVSDKRGGWTVRNLQSQGTLNISRISNNTIADKSSREGIVDNVTFRILRNVLIGLISIVENDRSYIYRACKKFSESSEESLRDQKKGQEVAKKVLQQKSKHREEPPVSEEDVFSMAEAIASYEKQTDELIDELKLLRSLATNGLITSAITHDLRGKTKTLVARTDILLHSLKAEKYDDVEKGLTAMSTHDAFLKSWMETLLNQLKIDRRKRIKKNLGEVVGEAVSSLKPILMQKKVKISFHNNSDRELKLFETDINSIIYNLIINSLEEFELQKIVDRSISIEVNDKQGNTHIRYSDSGKGLGNKFESPETILRFGTSSKKTLDGAQYGTGLGMYIVDSTMGEYGGTVEFIKYKESFEIDLAFPGSR